MSYYISPVPRPGHGTGVRVIVNDYITNLAERTGRTGKAPAMPDWGSQSRVPVMKTSWRLQNHVFLNPKNNIL